jgi:hyperosmotically inducible periplasmic protein
MKRTMIPLALTSVLLVLAAVGCRSMTGQSLGTNIDNQTTTAAVKARLTADQLQNLTWVDVDTNAGIVYLSGNAASQAQKARAEEIARGVDGVQRVVNNIQVRPSAASGTGRESGQASGASASAAVASGGHAMIGEVVNVDHATGHLTLRTGEGDMMLHFPPSAVAGVKPGDRVRVELVRAAR